MQAPAPPGLLANGPGQLGSDEKREEEVGVDLHTLSLYHAHTDNTLQSSVSSHQNNQRFYDRSAGAERTLKRV